MFYIIMTVLWLFYRLTYKYSRLVHNGTGHPDELPHVEKCGMDEDEEDEDDEEVEHYPLLWTCFLFGHKQIEL